MADIPTRIRRVELRCSNVEASAEFYARLTGLEPTRLSSKAAELRAPDGGETLLLLRRADSPGRAPVAAAGLFHTAFRYPARALLAESLTRLERVGARLTGVADHGVSEALYLDDPDGLGIELYRDRPTDEWPEPEPGERVRMFSQPLDVAELAAAAGTGVEDGSGRGPDIGHVHLKVADTAAAERFWTEEVGMDLMTRFGSGASFLGADGYHHHIGANSWHSLGAALEPAEGPGLERIVVAADRAAGLETPDGVIVELRAG